MANASADRVRADVLVAGATAPGLVAAVRAAREGLSVALVTPEAQLGGSFPSLGAIETHYAGNRAPLLEEVMARIRLHYAATYGENSEPYRTATGGGLATGGMLTFEPRVAEIVCEAMIAAEKNIRVWRRHALAGVTVRGGLVREAAFAHEVTGARLTVEAAAFVEAADEGDFMAAAGVEFRVGREARAEFGEPNAGRVFARWVRGQFPRDAVEGRLNLLVKSATTESPLPGSTGEGDGEIQNYSVRLCLSRDPANRRKLDAPPAGYDREAFAPILRSVAEKETLRLPFHHRLLIYTLEETAAMDHVFHGHPLPNRKRSWNATNLTAGSRGYATAGPAARRAIERRHVDHALGLMWFLQNDPAVPAAIRAQAAEWGLAADEFSARGHVPPMYVREARRLAGRAVFTENDARLAPGLARAPVRADSIGITEFSLDSLACTMERRPGTLCDGQLFQMEASRPGQVGFGVMLPRAIENLIVVNPMSATHVGWGAVRQTPTLMHLAESAAWAVVLAARTGRAVAAVGVDALQRHLAARGVMLAFFNDVDMNIRDPWISAVQYLGTKGFFGSYDARPADPLSAAVARLWVAAVGSIARADHDAMALARAVRAAETAPSPPISRGEFHALLGRPAPAEAAAAISRAAACHLCFETSALAPPP
ncbi:MAG: FAD-dependent oxidoreductase [Opitutaceae bacterium]|nr:FAD-dependent oxidoreductase [Opitutaceae bacterium]